MLFIFKYIIIYFILIFKIYILQIYRAALNKIASSIFLNFAHILLTFFKKMYKTEKTDKFYKML